MAIFVVMHANDVTEIFHGEDIRRDEDDWVFTRWLDGAEAEVRRVPAVTILSFERVDR